MAGMKAEDDREIEDVLASIRRLVSQDSRRASRPAVMPGPDASATDSAPAEEADRAFLLLTPAQRIGEAPQIAPVSAQPAVPVDPVPDAAASDAVPANGPTLVDELSRLESSIAEMEASVRAARVDPPTKADPAPETDGANVVPLAAVPDVAIAVPQEADAVAQGTAEMSAEVPAGTNGEEAAETAEVPAPQALPEASAEVAQAAEETGSAPQPAPVTKAAVTIPQPAPADAAPREPVAETDEAPVGTAVEADAARVKWVAESRDAVEPVAKADETAPEGVAMAPPAAEVDTMAEEPLEKADEAPAAETGIKTADHAGMADAMTAPPLTKADVAPVDPTVKADPDASASVTEKPITTAHPEAANPRTEETDTEEVSADMPRAMPRFAIHRGGIDDDLRAPFQDDEDDAEPSNLPGIDEEALRQLVSRLIREELQGVLGQKITQNVRKLVRREIQRSLIGTDFE